MLNFRDTAIVFIFLLIGMMGCDHLYDFSSWYYIIPVLLFFTTIFIGSYFIQSGYFLKALCGGNEKTNQIAITFDDGPHAQTTQILDVLKANNATAAFFCIGKNIAGKEQVLKRIAADGHVVSNHSYSHHYFFDFFSVRKLKEDVKKTDDLIFELTGRKNRLFRPPFGVTTPNIARMAKELNYTVIGWNLRSFDTTIRNQERLLKRIFSGMRAGSVILLHDTTPAIGEILQKVLDHAREKNLEVVSLEKMFQLNAYEPHS